MTRFRPPKQDIPVHCRFSAQTVDQLDALTQALQTSRTAVLRLLIADAYKVRKLNPLDQMTPGRRQKAVDADVAREARRHKVHVPGGDYLVCFRAKEAPSAEGAEKWHIEVTNGKFRWACMVPSVIMYDGDKTRVVDPYMDLRDPDHPTGPAQGYCYTHSGEPFSEAGAEAWEQMNPHPMILWPCWREDLVHPDYKASCEAIARQRAERAAWEAQREAERPEREAREAASIARLEASFRPDPPRSSVYLAPGDDVNETFMIEQLANAKRYSYADEFGEDDEDPETPEPADDGAPGTPEAGEDE